MPMLIRSAVNAGITLPPQAMAQLDRAVDGIGGERTEVAGPVDRSAARAVGRAGRGQHRADADGELTPGPNAGVAEAFDSGVSLVMGHRALQHFTELVHVRRLDEMMIEARLPCARNPAPAPSR